MPKTIERMVDAKTYLEKVMGLSLTSTDTPSVPFGDERFRNCLDSSYKEEFPEASLDWTSYLSKIEEYEAKEEAYNAWLENKSGDAPARDSLPSPDEPLLTELKKITKFSCSGSAYDDVSYDLTGLNLLTELKTFKFSGKIDTIDVSSNTKLETFELASAFKERGIKDSTIDLSQNKDLKSIKVSGQNIETINLEGNLNLKTVQLFNNSLASIKLPYSSEDNETLSEITLSSNKLTGTLDLSKYLKLTKVSVSSNQLEDLILPVPSKEGEDTLLTSISADYNNLSKLENIDKHKGLKSLYLSNNKLTDIDISKNTNLETVDISSNNLKNIAIDTTSGGNLKSLNLSKNNLSIDSFDLSKYPLLETLNLSNNQIVDVKLGEGEKLKKLDLSNNVLEEKTVKDLNLGSKVALEEINLSSNNLTDISLAGEEDNNTLKTVNLSNNNLVHVDVTKNKNLTTLDLANNKITNINLQNNQKLLYLTLTNNPLASLDLSNNKSLSSLLITNNLFVSDNTIFIYKDNEVVLDETKLDYRKYLILPEIVSGSAKVQKTAATMYSKSSSKDLTVTSNEDNKNLTVSSSKPGMYSIEVGYRHNVYRGVGPTKDHDFKISYKVGIVELTSTDDSYLIDNEKGYIFVGHDSDKETILSKLTLNKEASEGGVTINLDVETKKVTVNVGEEVIKEFTISDYYSEEYDLTKDYIFLGKDEFDASKIITSSSVTVESDENYVYIYHDSTKVREFLKIKYTSEYDLSKEYLYLGLDAFDLSKVEVTDDERVSESYEDGIYKITYTKDGKSEVVSDTKIVTYKANEGINYKLTDKYIYTDSASFNKDNISVLNGTIMYADDDTIYIKYGSQRSDNIDIVSYKIDEKYKSGEGFIYIGKDKVTSSIIKEVINGESSLSSDGNTIKIIYDGEEVDQKVIISYTSDTYNLDTEYNYIGSSTFDRSKITYPSNPDVTLSYVSGYLTLSYKGMPVVSTKLVSHHFISRYSGYSDKDYLYLAMHSYESNIIVLVHAQLEEVKDGDTLKELKIKYADTILKTYQVLSIDLGNLSHIPGEINIGSEKYTYDDFIQNVHTYGENLTFKLYNRDAEVSSGTITDGMILKIIYNDEVIDSYEIVSHYKEDYLEFSDELDVLEDEKYITNIIDKTTASYIKENTFTSGTVEITSQDGEVKDDDSAIATGDKIVVTMSESTEEYTLIVLGDVNGDGEVNVFDVARAFNYYYGKTEMEDYFARAGNVLLEDDEVTLFDVTKLFWYVRGKINSLED